MKYPFLRSIAFVFFLFSSLFTIAQYTLKGQVKHNDGRPLGYASLVLIQDSDTNYNNFQISREDGSFEFKSLEAGQYVLITAFAGMAVDSTEIELFGNVDDLNILLFPAELTLKEVMTLAKRIPLMFNGDTIVYNAGSYKTNASANVEDLFRKMPGVEVKKDGSITTGGEPITKILINGKEFFGGNVEAATKNIDASLVDKVEVIDRKTEQDELDVSGSKEREKVINLVLKKEMNHGYFGNVRAGAGPDGIYDVHGNINFFHKETQLSVIGGLNNLNAPLLGWQEMSKLDAFEINPFNDWNSMSWSGGGVNSYRGVGVNLNITPTKKFKSNVSYVLGIEDNVRINENISEVFIGNTTLNAESLNLSNAGKLSHQVNWTAEYKPDTLTTIKLRTQAARGLQDQLERSLSVNSRAGKVLNSGVRSEEEDDVQEKFAAKLNWNRRSKNGKNTWYGSIYTGGSRHKNSNLAFFNFDTTLQLMPETVSPIIDQQLNSRSFSMAATTSWKHQIGNKLELSPEIRWMRSAYHHEFIWIDQGVRQLPNSPAGNIDLQVLEYQIHAKWNIDSFTTLYLTPNLTQNIEERRFTSDSVYSVNNPQFFFLPGLYLRSSKTQKYEASIHTYGQVRRPGVTEMLPAVNNTNPLNTVEGNLALQNYAQYNGGGRFRKILALDKSVFVSTWFSYSMNPVVRSQQVSQENLSYSSFINFRNRSNSNHSLGMRLPVKWIKADLEFSLQQQYGQSFVLQNNDVIMSRNMSYGTSTELEFNQFDLWSLNLSYELMQNNGVVGEVRSNTFLSHDIYAEVMVNPNDHWELSSDLAWEIFGSNATADFTSIPIWSAQLMYRIDKKKQWSVGVSAFDLLKRNQNVWRWWDVNSFTEFRTNALQRYVLLTIRYDVKNNAKSADRLGRMH